MSQPDLLFACTSTSFQHIKLRVLHRPPIKATGGISDVFVWFATVLSAFFGEGHVFGFQVINFFSACKNFLFEEQLSLGIVSEFFKHVPVNLKTFP